MLARAPAEGERAARPRAWYGWQTLSLDSAALALLLVGRERVGSHRTNGVLLETAGLAGYALAAPAVHFAHGQPRRAALSLGLRVGLPLLVGGVLAAEGAARCPDGPPEDPRGCERLTTAILVAGSLSMLAASIADATVLAWEPKLPPLRGLGRKATTPAFSLAPTVDFAGARGGRLGLVAIF